MALPPQLEVLHTTLEFVQQNQIANTSVNRRSSLAPERDPTADNPQAVFGIGPEVHYKSEPPEAIDRHSEEQEHNVDNGQSPAQFQSILGFSKRKFWLLAIAAFIVLIGGNIAIGLGVGLSAQDSQTAKPYTIPSPSVPSTTANHTPPTVVASAKYTILNDTSFAAVSTSDGNRHVFFQDQTGCIRETIYNVVDMKWLVSVTYLLATDAKNYTALSAFQVSSNVSGTGTEQIYLFYISRSNNIAFRFFDGNTASWTNKSSSYPSLPGPAAAEESRALSVLPNLDHSKNGLWTTHVLYHGEDGNVSWVFGSWQSCSDDVPQLRWEPVGVLSPQASSTPVVNGFSLLSLEALNLPVPTIQATFLTCLENDAYIFALTYYNGSSHVSPSYNNNSASIIGAPLCSSLERTDIVQAYIQTTADNPISDTFWIQDSTLVAFHEPYSYPLCAAPYYRLASMSPANSTKTYMYHQLGPTRIGEEILDYSLGIWISNNFTVNTT